MLMFIVFVYFFQRSLISLDAAENGISSPQKSMLEVGCKVSFLILVMLNK